jgi:hypothetical protein
VDSERKEDDDKDIYGYEKRLEDAPGKVLAVPIAVPPLGDQALRVGARLRLTRMSTSGVTNNKTEITISQNPMVAQMGGGTSASEMPTDRFELRFTGTVVTLDT